MNIFEPKKTAASFRELVKTEIAEGTALWTPTTAPSSSARWSSSRRNKGSVIAVWSRWPCCLQPYSPGISTSRFHNARIRRRGVIWASLPRPRLPVDFQLKPLRCTPITSLPEGLIVGGSLFLGGTKITTLPEGLSVGGGLDLRRTPLSKTHTEKQIRKRRHPILMVI